MGEWFKSGRYSMVSAQTIGGQFVMETGLTAEQAIAMLRDDPRDLRGSAYVGLAMRLEVEDEDGDDTGETDFQLSPVGVSLALGPDAMAGALRQIATAVGTPAHVDPLADLPGLVLAVQAVVQRAESSAIVAAERDRRIDPVEHARAVMEAWLACFVSQASAEYEEHGTSEAILWRQAAMGWAQSAERAALLARVGPDVLAEVER